MRRTDLKWTFSTQTVTMMDTVTRIIVNKRYFPSKGTASDVGGIISASSKKNTVKDTKIEMQRVTYPYPNRFELSSMCGT